MAAILISSRDLRNLDAKTCPSCNKPRPPSREMFTIVDESTGAALCRACAAYDAPELVAVATGR